MKPNPLILLILFVISVSAMAQYQNHSGLKNRKLRLASVDNSQIFENIRDSQPSDEKLPDWPPGGKSIRSKSGVDSVIVLDDAPLQLTVMVYFSGISKVNIHVSVSTDNAQAKSYIPSQMVTVMEGQSPAEITLKANIPENMEVQSSHLSVELKDPDHIAKQKDYVFSLVKRWTSQIKGENLVQVINLEPIGSAASLWQLAAADPLPNPAKVAGSTNTPLATRTSIPAPGTGDKTPRGPSRQPFSLWDNIKTDIDFELSDINNIRTEIYPDINPASETFYISPVAYNLRWNKEDGYQNFRVLYGANNQVMFHAGLDAGITSKQLETTRYLIRKLMKSQNIEMLSPKIQLFGANTAPSMSLKSDFQGVFQLDPSKMDVTAPTDFTSPMQVSWATDNKTRDMIVLALQNGVGLNGTLTFGADSIVRKIPVSIAFNDKRNYGKIILEKETWRQNGWQNPFPYPVKIRYMHALLDNGSVQNDGSNYIYSWNCNGPVAPPSSRINFNGAKIPQWFDGSNKVIQVWLEYDIVPCQTCTQALLQSLTTGLSGSSETSIAFQSMDLVNSLDAKLVQIRIKSTQADPAHNREAEISANIAKDGEDIRIGPLYPGQDKHLSYQYKIIVVSNHAQVETNWISETSPQVYLNKANLEKIMGRPLK